MTRSRWCTLGYPTLPYTLPVLPCTPPYPGYTSRTPSTAVLPARQHQGRQCLRREPWAQETSCSLGKGSLEALLARVVTVLREESPGPGRRYWSRTLKDWIEQGRSAIYTALSSIWVEKARFLPPAVLHASEHPESPLLHTFADFARPRMHSHLESHFCSLFAPFSLWSFWSFLVILVRFRPAGDG